MNVDENNVLNDMFAVEESIDEAAYMSINTISIGKTAAALKGRFAATNTNLWQQLTHLWL